ncbi:hypothetical protein RRG08_008990 [Elysia crispata]|uniref:Uncharacterized protein n=1 Tax=Elysia crispata TaxID=231223 RepID=A0AAE0YUB0_9GAST|nr:hypothetical protein RRG08_008990 [Elysia crispata]
MIQASHLNNQHRSGIKKLIHSHARHSREINRSKYLPAESQKAKATTFLSLSRSVCISRPSAFKVSPMVGFGNNSLQEYFGEMCQNRNGVIIDSTSTPWLIQITLRTSMAFVWAGIIDCKSL